jgi:hypothetical protein
MYVHLLHKLNKHLGMLNRGFIDTSTRRKRVMNDDFLAETGLPRYATYRKHPAALRAPL